MSKSDTDKAEQYPPFPADMLGETNIVKLSPEALKRIEELNAELDAMKAALKSGPIKP